MRTKIAIGIAGFVFLAYLLMLMFAGHGSKAQPIGPVNQVFCNQIGTLTAGPTSITQVIAASGTQTIYVCGWHITNTGNSGTWTLSSGTGTNCGTGTNTVIPAQNVTSNAPSADHIDFAQFNMPSGSALCLTPSVATISGIIYFARF